MKLKEIIDILGWYPDTVNGVEEKYYEAVRTVAEWNNIVERLRKVIIEKQRELLNVPNGHPLGEIPIIKAKLRDDIKELQSILEDKK